MKIIVLVFAYFMLCGFQMDSLDKSYIPENYKVCEQVDSSELNKLLEWDSAKTTSESSSSTGETDTNTCTYYNDFERLEITVVESPVMRSLKSDGYTLKITPGSYNDETGEIIYEYHEIRNYFNVSLKYKTTAPYDQTERLFTKIAKLIEFEREEIRDPNIYIEP